MKLPQFEHFLQPSARPITVLGSSADADQLEIERADFGDVPARFEQSFAWPSLSDAKSSSALSVEDSHCNKEATDCLYFDSSRSYSHAHKDKHSKAADSNSQVTGPTVLSSSTQQLTSRLSLSLSQQVASLSEQLAAQVISTYKFYLLHQFYNSVDSIAPLK